MRKGFSSQLQEKDHMTHLLELFHDKRTMFHTRVFYKKVQNLTKQKGHPQLLQHSSNFQSIRLVFCNTSSPSCICKEQEVKNRDLKYVTCSHCQQLRNVWQEGDRKKNNKRTSLLEGPTLYRTPNNLIQTLRKHFSLYKIRTHSYFTHPTTMHLLMESH